MLTWTSDIIDAKVSVTYFDKRNVPADWAGLEVRDRQRWTYRITLPGFDYTNHDLTTPDSTSVCAVLSTLASFLDAWQEAITADSDSDNADLFPKALEHAIERHGAFIDELVMDVRSFD